MKKLLILVLLTSAAGTAPAQNWPLFRGPDSTGVAEGPAVPAQWDAEKGTNLLWRREIPGFGHSSPIVWGDRIFVTTAVSKSPGPGVDRKAQTLTTEDKSEFEWRVYALDKKSGKILWERTAHRGIPHSKRHPQSSQASSTPATDGRVIVAYFGSEGLYAFDMKGKLLWKKDLGLIDTSLHIDPDIVYGTASSPVIYRDAVILQVDKDRDSFIAAYSLKDGSQVWRAARDEFPSWSTPVLLRGPQRDELVTQAYKFTRGYDPATGNELWRFGKNGEQHIPSPVPANGLVYLVSGGTDVAPVYAIRPGASGDISLPESGPRSEHVVWYLPRGGVHIVSPLVYRGHMYVCADNGVLSVFDAASGERLYRVRLGKGGEFFASPIASGNHIIFFNQEGESFTIKAGPKFELVSQNKVGDLVMATPAVSAGVLYVRGYKNLYAIAETKGK